MSILFRKSGVLTTVQDLGRIGYQKYGVIRGGVMDHLASRLANMLVGNNEEEAVVEMTLMGATIEFQEEALIAISGGDMSPVINGKPVHMYRPIWMNKGSVLTFRQARHGCRVYLAIAGGWNVPLVMGSYSTYLRAGIGGNEGRAIQKYDVLTTGSLSIESSELSKALKEKTETGAAFGEASWGIHSAIFPELTEHPEVRVLKGREYEWFTEASLQTFFSEAFAVTTQSDRMGYRLDGPTLACTESKNLLSEAVTFGTIQVPSDGQPIILMADRQTTGGYAKIAQVITADLAILAQMKPEDQLRFKAVSHEEAQNAYMEHEHALKALQQSIHLKITKEVSSCTSI